MHIVTCIVLACLSFVGASAVSRCSEATFNFVEDETPNITCSGLSAEQGIYWSITGLSTGGQETRIGNCSMCAMDCSCDTHATDYDITRSGDNSTLFFVSNLPANNRSTIRCSTENNGKCVASSINILKAPVRCQHSNNCIEIVEDEPTPLTCQGAQDKDISWSVTRPSTPKTRIGNCSKCATITHLPCTCHTDNGDYNITRTGDTTTAVSILQFVNNVSSNDNSTIKCSTSDDNVVFSVSIDVIPAYRLTACRNNKIVVYENSKREIRCEGMEHSQSMHWSITYPNKTEETVAVCENCENETCPACDVKLGDFSVNRRQTFSVLRITGNDRDTDCAVVKCSKFNNTTYDECKLSVRYRGVPENASVVVDSNFVVTGRVHVNKVFSSDSVTCVWRDNTTSNPVPSDAIHLDLSTFTDINGREYQRGICNMTKQLNTSQMTHYFFVRIQPGNGIQFAGAVTIAFSRIWHPTCECNHLTAQHGNPPATISWRDVTDTAVLHVPSVHRIQNGTQFVCTCVWGAGTEEEMRSNHTYTLLVAGGDSESFPWVVVGVAVGATVLVIIIVIGIVVVIAKRRASRNRAEEHSAEANAADDEFEEHINDLYQSSDMDTPPLPDQCTPASAQQAFHLQPMQASSTPHGSNTESADPNSIQEMTQTAQPDDVYNVLGSTPCGDQKADPVYNHLNKC